MIGVDKIGQIRRAYFEQRRSIKEIVRTLSVSRATVREVISAYQKCVAETVQRRAMPSSRDIFKNIHRNSKGLINYYINSQIPFPANSNKYRFNNEFLSNQKL